MASSSSSLPSLDFPVANARLARAAHATWVQRTCLQELFDAMKTWFLVPGAELQRKSRHKIAADSEVPIWDITVGDNWGEFCIALNGREKQTHAEFVQAEFARNGFCTSLDADLTNLDPGQQFAYVSVWLPEAATA